MSRIVGAGADVVERVTTFARQLRFCECRLANAVRDQA
jgi:hypothetical protein